MDNRLSMVVLLHAARVFYYFVVTEIAFIDNMNALSSGESRVFVDTISSEEANRVRAFVIQRGGLGI